MPPAPLPTEETEQRRPTAVLLVYSWDLVLAILALFGALAPFAGGLAIGRGSVNLPLGVQIFVALVSASYAVTLIIVASMLTRRLQWVRRVQVLIFAVAIALIVVSIVVGYATSIGIDTPALLGNVLFVLFDALAILLMTERRVADWYTEAASVPRYLLGTLGFWAVGSGAFVVLELVLRG